LFVDIDQLFRMVRPNSLEYISLGQAQNSFI